ncbi:MAG: imidazoleglycerol-phosphate dehydratase, partial [Actinomycetota bacterium]|nr:imidazoleglycerol-phosphate dehydratase [Actinomycetota bacterium]
MTRQAECQRKTKETNIDLSINVDGSGQAEISTGLPFFDHMLSQLGKHSRFDLSVNCEGDIDIDSH